MFDVIILILKQDVTRNIRKRICHVLIISNGYNYPVVQITPEPMRKSLGVQVHWLEVLTEASGIVTFYVSALKRVYRMHFPRCVNRTKHVKLLPRSSCWCLAGSSMFGR